MKHELKQPNKHEANKTMKHQQRKQKTITTHHQTSRKQTKVAVAEKSLQDRETSGNETLTKYLILKNEQIKIKQTNNEVRT